MTHSMISIGEFALMLSVVLGLLVFLYIWCNNWLYEKRKKQRIGGDKTKR